MRTMAGVGLVIALLVAPTARAGDDHANWPQLTSTFPSTGGGGMIIKGYDPVVTGQRCITTFMAVEPGDSPAVHPNIIEFEAIPIDGGILCRNGRWRAFEGSASGTTPFRLFLKDGIWRGR